ncbi:hypothetical protein Rsub_01274 [Raphidocelis subcapitata]|uniref:Uncharacterized protein n=1 Tax=Raphidocelis subcapitata TaxID=307507 RepID=A0A2V0NN11_9CHLO|nr:hypothetical protein Rsub_01274 [Raphidocelis subcapitata]|eukprot:GBF88559.1 hypothetical protein Rsub_01274 [Raphidocelis subcapitata]
MQPASPGAAEAEALREELADAKREAAELRQQLAAARAEAAHWRELHEQQQQQQQQQQQRRAADAAPSGNDDRAGAAPPTPGSLAKMQERLGRLRKEQAEAEAARAAAWEELRSVVSDISAVASVDNLSSVNIPRGSTGL